MTNRNSDVGSQAHTQDNNAAGQSRSAVEPSNSGSNHDDISIVDRPRQGQSRSAVEPSNSGSNHDDISIVDQPRQDGHSSDDSDLGRPIFASSPIVSRSAAAVQKEAKRVIGTLYDSVVTSCAVVKEGHDLEAQATEVGTIEDEENLLIGAEANPRNGPAFDLELLRKIMAANDLPLVLPFMCRDAREMREQCHADCTPLVLIRYVPTNRAIVILRALLTAADLLGTCYLHASLQGSNFDENACGKHQQSTIQDEVEIRVMHPTLSSNRMIIGSIVAGTERNFLEDVLKAIKQAHEAAKALKAHRDLLERDRALRAEQEQELQASEAADMAKTTAQAKLGALDEGASLNDTLADTEEVRKRRLEVFAVEASFKRPRDDHSDGDGDGDGDSGTITFKTQ